ncbi:MAG: isochorismate-pyruvate lyase [Bacteroidales bacterium]|nr:isochorismate-pyruvate lyase [Bacteroidales bacterium]
MKRKAAGEYKSLQALREQIDSIDKEIIELLSERFGFVKEVTKYKEPNANSIIAHERYNQVISERGRWAEEKGLCGDLIKEMYTNLLNYFIEEETRMLKIKQ